MQVMSASEGWAGRFVVHGMFMILNKRQLHGAHTAWAVQRKQKRLRRMSPFALPEFATFSWFAEIPRNVSVAAKDEAARALDDSNRSTLKRLAILSM